MTLDTQNAKKLLKEFNFKELFIEELGWDHYSKELRILVKDDYFNLNAIAQKRGVQIFIYMPDESGGIPDYNGRKKIEKEVTKSAHEHLVIYPNQEKTLQIWQWVSRTPGKAAAYREYKFDSHQSFELLIQKLDTIAFTLDDEEELTLSGVTVRLKDALDKDRVTRRFYDIFAKKSKGFLNFVEGISKDEDREWYSSVMLNRLMFIYFIQRKGFLDDDRNYLRNHLYTMQSKYGKDKFYSFYRYFLLRLFHEGLGKKIQAPELEKLLGKIPYLNGGLFQEHFIEQNYNDIQIPDKAFEEIFRFFDQYEWHLDDRPLKKGNEINPDVLGYIFEKFINQKEMGAYYTKEDITNYTCVNTIIPFLFDSIKEDCKITFDLERYIWNFAQEDPDRYIYDSVKKGTSLELPNHIAIGINDVSKRTEWNKPADEEYSLPTEIWRETIARRDHYKKVRDKLVNGEIKSINDFITYNLDLRQFAQDVIENSEDVEIIRAFYKAIVKIKILDPAVGSGAFLFAALNILEALYEACLNRMQIFLEECGEDNIKPKYQDFKEISTQVEKHSNCQYFIYKSIILNNLHGVDIMDEATEICKLRLFLKLASVIEDVNDIDALPDIDFNICTGNTLVGFTSREDVEEAIITAHGTQKKLRLPEDDVIMKRIEMRADESDIAFQAFKKIQISHIADEKEMSKAKNELQFKLKILENELNGYLASQYNINKINQSNYQDWYDKHKPFHWFVEFYGIMKDGGFDVIIGNPPFVEYRNVTTYSIRGYKTENCGNLYAFMFERSHNLLNTNGRFGMIAPFSSTSTPRMKRLVDIICSNGSIWISNFDERPSYLFNGVCLQMAIILHSQNFSNRIFVTPLNHWSNDERQFLFTSKIKYLELKKSDWKDLPNKFGNDHELSIDKKILNNVELFENIIRSRTDYLLFYRTSGGRYFKLITKFEPFFKSDRGKSVSSKQNDLSFDSNKIRDIAVLILNSTLFYWFWRTRSNCRDLTMKEIKNFPTGFNKMSANSKTNMVELCSKLMIDLKDNSIKKVNRRSTGTVEYEEFYPKLSKGIINKIDHELAKLYSFTPEELDFIINYDIKYRMGN